MANIVIPFAAVALAVVPSVGFNNNFTEIASKFNTYAVQTDVAKVVTVSHTWNASQNIGGDLLFTDALYDIGKTGATRPRDGFFSRNLTVGGALAVTGAVTFGSLGMPLAQNLTFVDATYDIGATGATRPRDGFFSRNLKAQGIQLTFNHTLTDAISLTDTGGMSNWIIGPGSGGGSDGIGFYNSTAGFLKFNLRSTGELDIYGDLLFLSDGLFDIGKTGATRPRDGFFSRNVVIGGTLSIGNDITLVKAPTLVNIAAGSYIDFRLAGSAGSALLINDTGTVQISNGVLICVNAGVKTLLSTNAALPAAGAAQNGLLAIDTTNSRLVYYVNALRYWIPIGTSF